MIVDDRARESLIRAACEMREVAYAPYSDYSVGAALLADDGRIYTGTNVENASYGLSMCAERIAVYKMISEGVRRILAIAICTDNGGSPCGACRQVLSEFAGDIPVWLSDKRGNVRQTTLYALLPDHFGPEHLT